MIELFYRYFKNKLPKKKEPKKPEEIGDHESQAIAESIAESIDENSSGAIVLSWNDLTGDFNLYIDIFDNTTKNADTLSILLYYLNEGDLKEYFVRAIEKWAEGDTEKGSHAIQLFTNWQILSESTEGLNAEEDVAVNPHEVFNFGETQRDGM